MSRGFRIAGYVFLGLTLGLGLIVGALFVLTETEFGLERVRRFALDRLAGEVEGELRVARIESKGLLGGVVLYDIAIDDRRGRPFLRADSARLYYRWRTLLLGRVVFDRLRVYRPEVHVERLPGDTAWNFERIFPDRTPGIDEPDNLILIDRAEVSDGLIVVRFPWRPDPAGPVEPDDTARLILRQAPGGLVRELRFEDVDAAFPRVLWESPVEEGKLFRIARLSTRGYIWETPFDLRDLAGDVTIRDSLIAFDVDRFRLPGTRGSGIGRIVVDDGRSYDVRIVGDEVALRDLRWLYPPFPPEGRAELVFRIQSQPRGTLWLVQDAHIRAPGTDLRGDFGIVTGDTLYFTRVALRASPINLDLLADVLPGDLPLEGLMVGTVVVEGPISSLTADVDVRLARADGRGAEARIRGTGTVGLRPPYAVENVDASVERLDVALVPALRDRLRLRGVISGRVRATGRLDRSLRFAAAVRHQLAGRPSSELRGRGTVRYASRGASALDATLEAEPLALEMFAAIPGLAGVRGEVRGPVRVRGPLSDLTLDARLATPGGRIEVGGRIDLATAGRRYAAEGRLTGFRLDRILEGVAETTLTARIAAEAAGRGAPSLLRVEIGAGNVGPVELSDGIARIRVQDGLAHVDSLRIRANVGVLEASGSIGLAERRPGALELSARLDSLAALRSGLVGGAALALGDTLRSRIGGAAFLRASIRGSVPRLDADGELRLDQVTYHAAEVGRADLRFAARDIGTDSVRVRLRGDASGAAVYDRPLDSVHATVEYDQGGGRIELEARATGPVLADYRVAGGFRRSGRGVELDLREVRARDWIGDWRLAQPARVRVGGDGLGVDGLLLARADGEGRVRADGRIPWGTAGTAGEDRRRPAGFHLEVERLPLEPPRLGSDAPPPASALLSGTVYVSGRAAAPLMTADLRLEDVRYDDVRLDLVDARLEYAGRRLEGRLEARFQDQPILSGEGRVPVDLALAPVRERRLAEPLDIRIRADRVPAVFATGLARGFRNVRGELTGLLTVGGTTRDPELGGEFALRGGEAVWEASGVRYRGVEGNFRVLADQVVAVDLNARTDLGTAAATGTLTFSPLTDPRLDLRIVTREFQLARRRDVAATGTGEVRLDGRYSEPRVTGNIRVDRGELFLEEVWHRYNLVSIEDLFGVVDTSLVSVRKLLPASTSPFLRNLTVQDFTIDVGRETWLRGRTLDVEVAGRLRVDFDRRAEDLRLTGTLNAIRGSYELYLAEEFPVRRFAVREGTVEFDGTPGINPRLDIVATHRVRTEGGPLNVEAVVTGTLRNPRVGLRSDAEPPIAESDLLSLVVFGRPTSQLARLGAQDERGGRAGGGLVNLAAPTVFGYASTGLESLVADLGFDYFAITEYEGGLDAQVPAGVDQLFARSQLEVGRYVPVRGQDLYFALRRRLWGGNDVAPFDWRLEWRFAPTWTAELFSESRFFRGLGYGLDQSPKANGFFLFREWGF